MAQFGLLANVLAVPMMGLVVMPAAVMAAMLAPLGLDGFALSVMGGGIGWILMVADWVAHLDGAVRPIMAAQWPVLALVTLAGLVLCLMRGTIRLAGLPIMAIALVIWSAAQRPNILVDPDGRLLGLMTDDGRALNKQSAYSYAASTWLQNDGDSASQAEAYARAGLQVYQGGNIATLNNGWRVVLHWARGVPETPCTADTLFIFTAHNFDLRGPCTVITVEEFTAGGARAIWVNENGLSVVQTLSPNQRHYWQIQ